MTFDILTGLLTSLGYTNIKKISSTKIAVLVDTNRIETAISINKALKGSVYNKEPTSQSSIGVVKYYNMSILVKPASKQGSSSAGVENEEIVIKTINAQIKKGPINVVFNAKGKSYTIIGCKEAKGVGADTAGRKKADIVLIDSKNKKYSISIKKDNAEIWESADSYFGAEAKKIIKKALSENKTKLVKESSYFKIEPTIAVKANAVEKRGVVFGADLENGGAVITKTFTPSSFKMNEDTLTIECSNIITQLSEVKGDKDVYFLIRNDKTRKSIKEYPGIRVLAVYAKRINKNVEIVKR